MLDRYFTSATDFPLRLDMYYNTYYHVEKGGGERYFLLSANIYARHNGRDLIFRRRILGVLELKFNL